MKKTLTFALTLSLVCCLASCNNSDNESSKTSDSQAAKANEQSITTTTTASTTTTTTTTAEKTTTTTTTTTTATTTPQTTTTTTQTFDTSYYKYESSQLKVAKYDISLYAAPDKSSEVLYNLTEGAVIEVIGEVDNDWETVLIDENIVFVEKFTLDISTTSFSTTTTIVKIPVR